MEFTLYYCGDLKANRGAKDKHRLRRHFHKQLKELWDQPPLIRNPLEECTSNEKASACRAKPFATLLWVMESDQPDSVSMVIESFSIQILQWATSQSFVL